MGLKARNILDHEKQQLDSDLRNQPSDSNKAPPSFDEEHGGEAEQLINNKTLPHDESANIEASDKHADEEKHTAPDSFELPTKKLSIIICVLLIITYRLLKNVCADASASLQKTYDIDGDVESRSVTSWRVLPGKTIDIRSSVSTTGRKIGNFSATEAKSWDYFKVYGKPHRNQLHIVSPVNGWTSEITKGGERLMEPIPHDEELLNAGTSHVPFCPLIDAGRFTSDNNLSRYQYAPTSLVVAQQFWNASQVLYYFLLIALFSVMEYPSFSSSMSGNTKAFLWCFLILFTILTVFLLPFSAYCISPGGHALAVIMAVTSLATVYFSPPNVPFTLVDLPPQGCTPKQYPRSETNDAIVISGKGLCKVEHIAFLCNLGSSMYNYGTLGFNVFPYWARIYRCFDKLFGLTGGNFQLNHAVRLRFIYDMGIRSYHLPLYMPLPFGSTTGAKMFLCLWSILPFIYTFYFMSMYVMAKRVQGVIIQRFFALFGVFHFLFLTDIVAYKYGRGVRNEMSEHFHWAERLAWRIAMLLPIYQNVLSGHFKHTQRNKRIGPALHYFMAGFGIFFFVYQCVLNDFVHYPQWLRGKKQTHILPYHQLLGYLGSVVIMAFSYGFMMSGGTWCHHLFVGPEGNSYKKASAQ